ncbi:hypothetical protein [Kiloniella sp.]|uniref:hypothetical protein n=1 Tax=Kiloniella sp. TaxID=1938587 RepID=UPI003B023F54
MPSHKISSEKKRGCCELSVETLLSRGEVPVDAVIDALFSENSYSEVKLTSNFDPIPLRLNLKKLGCKIIREKSKEGWIIFIIRDDKSKPLPEQVISPNKPKFNFDGEMLNMDVMGYEFPDNFLEVLRFIDRSLEEERFRVKMKSFPKRLQELLKERDWSYFVESNQNDHVILLLEKN